MDTENAIDVYFIRALSARGTPPEMMKSTAIKQPEGLMQIQQDVATKSPMKTGLSNSGKGNEILPPNQCVLHFSSDIASGKVVMQIIDLETNKVVRQIPVETVSRLASEKDWMTGLVIDEKT